MEACGEKGGEERMVEKVRGRVCIGREKIARFCSENPAYKSRVGWL
jgi:hypothetical protein